MIMCQILKNKKKLFYLIDSMQIDSMQTPRGSDNFIYLVDANFINLILKKLIF